MTQTSTLKRSPASMLNTDEVIVILTRRQLLLIDEALRHNAGRIRDEGFRNLAIEVAATRAPIVEALNRLSRR